MADARLKLIELDEEDQHFLTDYVWSFNNGGRPITKLEGKSVGLHQLILPDQRMVDHRDGNVLNNKRSNLRSATSSQNNCNKRKSSKNTSGFKGVFLEKKPNLRNPWFVQIKINYISRRLGYYHTPEEAAKAYDIAASKYHGEFAKLNFPNEVRFD